MVKVTPHRYSFDSYSWTFPDIGHGSALELYFVGDVSTGHRAWPGSWVLDDRNGTSSSSLPGDYYGTDVRGTPDEVARWIDAQRAAEAALRDAETQLLHDLGLMEVRHGSARQLRGAPGWRALLRRSRGRRFVRRALAEYRNRTGRIQEMYAPVRDEIAARVREAQKQARERWERDARTITPTRVHHSGRTVHVSAHTSFGVGFSPPSPHC